MECSCNTDYSIESDEFWDFFAKRYLKARKVHVCYECQNPITPGEIYVYEKGKFVDGYFMQYRTCIDCISVRNNFFSSWIFGQIWEDISEMIYNCNGEVPEKCISELTPLARSRVCSLIEKAWAGLEGE